mgnify:FL=1
MQDSGFKEKDRLTTNFPQDQFVNPRGGEHKVMKKVVNSVLASALALSVAPMAFAEEATTPEDTAASVEETVEAVEDEEVAAPAMDADLEKVVKRLEALGLVAGYGNGDFGVDRTITRAEFATLVVRARGLEQGAKLAQFQSNFKDVNASDWFAGFVNVAAGQEIIKGFPDQTFKPQNQVTYAEAITMIIRALGHEPAVKGEWPNGFLAKASELGVAKTISNPNAPATRGDIFKFLDNALRVDLMEQVAYGTDVRYEVTNETLLTKYLNVIVRDMEWAHDTPNRDVNDLPFVSLVPTTGLAELKANEVKLSGRNADLGGNTKFKVADGINVNDFDGQHVQVWIKDDVENTVVWMEASTAEEVIVDRIDTFQFKGKDMRGDASDLDSVKDLDDLKIVLDGSGKSYRFNKDTKITYNYNPLANDSDDDLLDALADIIESEEDYYVKIVLNDENEISYIHIIDDVTKNKKETGVKYGSAVIEKISNDKKIKNIDGKSFTELKDLDEGKDFIVLLNNEPATLADLKPMDVYSVYYSDGEDDKLVIIATRNVVEGEVERVNVRNSSDHRLVVNGESYRVKNGATYSEDKNDDVTEITSKNQDILRDLDGEKVKLYLDAAGRVRHIETSDDLTDRKFKAIVIKEAVYDKDEWNFTVYSEKGAKVKITIEADDIKYTDGKKIDEDLIEDLFVPSKTNPVLLEVTLDKDGDATKVEVLNDSPELFVGDWDDAADEDDELLKIGDTYYEITSDTAIFDMTGDIEGSKRTELKKPRILDWEDIADEDDLTVYYVLDEDDQEVEAIFVVDGDSLVGDYEYGQVLELGSQGKKNVITLITKDEDGTLTKKEFELDDSYEDLIDAGIRRGDFIAYQLNNNNEIIVDDVIEVVGRADDFEIFSINYDELANADIEDLVIGQVVDVDKNRVTLAVTEDGKEKKVVYTTSSTVYFNAYDRKAADGIDDGDYVILFNVDNDARRMDYVIFLASEDDVDDDNLDTSNFWKQTGDKGGEKPTPLPGDDFVDEDSVEIEPTVLMGGLAYIYDVTGEGQPGAEVKVTAAGKTATTTVGENGKFKVQLRTTEKADKFVFEVTLDGETQEFEKDAPEIEE